MSLPKYPKCKPSGVEWLGQIPVHWTVAQSRRMFKVRSEPAHVDDQMLTASQKYGVLPQAEFILREGRRVVEVIQGLDSLKHVEPDDFIISMRSFQGGIEWCRIRGSTSFHYVMLTPVKWVWPAFFAHLLKSVPYIQALRRTTDLIRDGQELRFSNFAQVSLPVIPIEEQKEIASFLDRETAKIDALIAEQEKLLTLLAEKRQATISHAVTKGLNPDVPMKDSGVAWLGEVPRHWVLTPLARISLERCDGPFGSGIKSEHYTDKGALVVRLQNIRAGLFNMGEPVFLDESYFLEELRGHEVKEGDLLVAGLGDDNNLLGRACVAPAGLGLALVKADCFRFRLDTKRAVPEFVAWQLSAGAAHDSGILSTGTTRSRIPLSIMSSRKLALPSAEEQVVIAAFIARENAKLDSLKAESERAIALLKERRSALIAAAVTGRIDVTGITK
ncbi:hypothetical protein [Zoogloea sp.]|uniref:hypothetical protein n=1 Tax=Zoogloea sp. TaxID=49181 RepID=UPI0035B255E0